MRKLGIQGAVGGSMSKTTIPYDAARPAGLVCHKFTAAHPNQLWAAYLARVAMWAGFLYAAFVTNLPSHWIVGWGASGSRRRDPAPDALDQVLCVRGDIENLIHCSVEMCGVHGFGTRRSWGKLGSSLWAVFRRLARQHI